MTVPDISAEDLARVEAMLMDDIRWAVEQGPGWDPWAGAGVAHGRWVDEKTADGLPNPCGVCAIGALCVRRQPPCPPQDEHSEADDIDAAAAVLGVGNRWCGLLYSAVAYAIGASPEARSSYTDQVWRLAQRLRAHGDALMAAKAVKP